MDDISFNDFSGFFDYDGTVSDNDCFDSPYLFSVPSDGGEYEIILQELSVDLFQINRSLNHILGFMLMVFIYFVARRIVNRFNTHGKGLDG